MGKKSTKEVVSSGNASIEQGYIQFGAGELIPATKSSSHSHIQYDLEKVRKEWEKHGRKKYSVVHTHPDNYTSITSSFPSGDDLFSFLLDDNAKSMRILCQEEKTGKVKDYIVIRKTKKTKPMGFSMIYTPEESESFFSKNTFIKKLQKWNQLRRMASIETRTNLYQERKDIGSLGPKLELAMLAERYGLQYRHVDESEPKFSQQNSLESRASSSVAIVGLSGSLFFSSINFTGNAISNLTQTTSNLIGVCLFCVGLVGAFFYLRQK